ncbi:MAG: hypothetical protein D6735_09660 [Acidobacteria bacterium]|nr:MAG: hypothetical protein D6735_09660 [Acidobacteriota bacterium]
MARMLIQKAYTSSRPTAPSSAAANEAAKPPREQSAAARCWAARTAFQGNLTTVPSGIVTEPLPLI